MLPTGIKCVVFAMLLDFARGDTEVSCVFMESCVLPCSFQSGHDNIIHWIKEPGNTFVHSYYYNQDQLSNQDQSFKGRTSLFTDQISRGNASLQLTGVKVQDQSRYKCYTSTISGNKELFISLKVDAPVAGVHIQQVENRIICSSEGIYPEPQLTWSTSPPSNMPLKNTTVQQSEQQLYSISSTLIPPHSTTDVVYSCTVSTRRNKREATLMQRGKEEDEEEKTKQDNNNPSNTAVIAGGAGGLLVIAAIAGLTAFCVCKRQRKGTGNASGTPEAIQAGENKQICSQTRRLD